MLDAYNPPAGLPANGAASPALPAIRTAGLVPYGQLPAAVRPEISVNELWRMLVKWRWLVLWSVAAGLAIAVATTLMMTPMYRAMATIEVNDEPTQVVQVGQVQPQVIANADNLSTQIGLLSSRSLAERVSRDLNLPNNPAVVSQELPRDSREAVAARQVEGNFTAEPVRDSRLVSLEYDSPDPELAARVANGFADGFIAANLERRFETTAYARQFLQNRINSVRQHLEASERQSVAYAKREGIIDVATGKTDGAGSLTTNSLVALNQALAQAETDRIGAQEKLRQSAGSVSQASALNNPVTQQMRSQLADLRSQVEENKSLFGDHFPAMVRLNDRIAALQKSLAQESASVSGSMSRGLEGEYRAALAREQQIRAKVNGLKVDALDLRDRSIEYTILQREVDTNRALYDGLLQRFKEVSVAGGVGENLVSIVDRAKAPIRPVSPRLLVNLAVGLLGGLLLGMAIAVAREIVSDAIETPDDIEEKLGLRTLGVVPRFLKRETNFLKLLNEPRSPIVEAYQSVASALRFATSEGAPKTLLVTSSRPEEGKSSSALGLANAFASSGKSVLLIDADMRKPTFKIGSDDVHGLSNLLTGDDDIDAAIYPFPERKLALMPSGPIPLSPAELLSTDRFRAILGQLSERFDMVIIDGPPVLGLADAPLMGAVTAGVLIVIESRAIRGQASRAIVARLRASGANIIGAVLTKYSDRGGSSGYGYGHGSDYGYGYGDTEKRTARTEIRLDVVKHEVDQDADAADALVDADSR